METYGLGITQRGDSLKGQGFVKVIDRLKEIQNAWIKVEANSKWYWKLAKDGLGNGKKNG